MAYGALQMAVRSSEIGRTAMYVSDLDLVWTPQLFYTYFYNHAHRPRLEKLL